jgi:hypothetical protein
VAFNGNRPLDAHVKRQAIDGAAPGLSGLATVEQHVAGCRHQTPISLFGLQVAQLRQ